MLSLTPPSKPEHTFDYSRIDLETLYTPPFAGDSARATARLYTLDKEPWKIIRPDSLNIILEYGGQGSLAGVPKKVHFDRGSITNLSDTLKGQQIGIISAEGDTLKFVYDGILIKQVSWSGTNGANTVNGKVTFRYNSDRQVITETVTAATGLADSVNLQYDQDGSLTSVGIMKLKYGTSNTLLLSDTVGNIVTNYGYDTFGALAYKETKYGATTLYRVDYARDSLSRIIEKTEINQGNVSTYGYTYDIVGRLSQVFKNDTLTAAYEYDQNGNRLAKITSADTSTGVYDLQDRLLKCSSTQYYYNANGDLTQKVKGIDTTLYSYDALGSLRSVTLPNGTMIEYLIDGSGRRVGRKVNGVAINKWLYSTDLRIIAELDSANKITSRFVYTSSKNVPEYFIKSDTVYRIITDHLGSVKQVVNTATSTIIQEIDYDAYGNVLFDSNPSFTPFGFAGGLYDSQTRLVRFGERDYDAEIGIWICKDPIRFLSKDVNLYEYTFGDPVNNTDLTGEMGIGLVFSASAEAGFDGVGTSIQGDLGCGLFWGSPKGFIWGGFASGGAFANNNMSPGPFSNSGAVGGIYAGYGAGIFMTTANTPSELGGWFDTYSLNTPWVGIQYSKGYSTTGSGRFIEYVSFTWGIGTPTISASNYNTYTKAFGD
jgi:RHS repeat-associated protein